MAGRNNGLGFARPRLTPLQEQILRDPDRLNDVEKQMEYIAASGQSDDFEGDVGPWRGTSAFDRFKAAWDRGMRNRGNTSGGSRTKEPAIHTRGGERLGPGTYVDDSRGPRDERDYERAAPYDNGSQGGRVDPRQRITTKRNPFSK